VRKKWEIIPVDDSQKERERADYIAEVISLLNDQSMTENMLTAVPDGFTVIELIWGQFKGKLAPIKPKQLLPELFNFDENGDLHLLSAINSSSSPKDLYKNLSKDEPRKFLVHSNQMEFNDPRGSAVMAACYWFWLMKKAGMAFWEKMLARFGYPSIIALFQGDGDAETKAEQREALAEALAELEGDAAGALNDVDEVKVLDARSSGGDFLDFCHFINSEFSKAILTETLTLETQGTGSYALGVQHFNVLNQWVVEKDTRAIANTYDHSLIPWIYQVNWGESVEYPKIKFDTTQKAAPEIIPELIAMGVKMNGIVVRDGYFFPVELDENGDLIIEKQESSPLISASLKKKALNPYI
jgi:phage gp29-like protein